MTKTINYSATETRKTGAFEKRIHEIDFIRGLFIILVIVDHLFLHFAQSGDAWFRATNIEGYKIFGEVFSFYWDSVARSLIRPLVLFGFTFISGISCAFSKDNWKRAGLMLVVYFAISIVTNIMDVYAKGSRIDFNIIGILAWSTIIYCFFQKRSWKSLAAFILISCLMTVYIIPILQSIPGISEAYVPALWSPEFLRSYYNHDLNCFVFNEYPNNGEITLGIKMGDYLPLFPYIIFFFMGALVSSFVYKDKKSIFPKRYEFERPICYIGRHSIWFYLLHQVIMFPIFWVLDSIIM